ncbi:MAG: hypothetical protein AAGG01_20885, partial [Planctomycetota bacterium]
TAAPAVRCCLEVTQQTESAFERFLPKNRTDAGEPAPNELAPGLFQAASGLNKLVESRTGDLEALQEKARKAGREIPPHIVARFKERQLKSAPFHPVEIEWGDEIWAGVHKDEQTKYGNAVVARKGAHVILLEWRGPTIEDPSELLKFVQPHLDRLASLEPGESWVEMWNEKLEITHEKDE